MNMGLFMFEVRTIWKELNIPNTLVKERFKKYFGEHAYQIENRNEAIVLLSKIINELQIKFCDRIKTNNVQGVIRDLYKVLDECYHIYIREKEVRTDMVHKNINVPSVTDTFEKNRNIAKNIIDATNIWIENCVLHQHEEKEEFHDEAFELDCELLIELFIYGLASQSMSLLVLSKKFKEKELFYGLKIVPDEDIPAEVIKEHPVIYFSTLIAGNQNVLTTVPLSLEDNDSEFGIGFYKENKEKFLVILALFNSCQKYLLYDGKVALTTISKKQFIDFIEGATNPPVKGESILNKFTLTKENLSTQLKKGESIIWLIGANKIRHELRPFVLLENDRVMISFCALHQALQMWASYSSNGGMCYTNAKDELTLAIEKRNKELSNILVERLQSSLCRHYTPIYNEIEVKYDRIFGKRDINYGDFDIVFFARETQELFLIEAKFFSDSLTSSGIVTDYEKLFVEDGYFDRCRRRYDLILKEADKVKEFIGVAKETIKVHLLFVSSKPLDIELQDKDGITTFLCMENFDKYLEGKFLDIDNESIVVRPTIEI